MIAGCASDPAARIDKAAAEVGRLKAGINLPDWPQYCEEPMPTVVPKKGEPVWGPQARWEVVRDNENARIKWCADHYRGIAAAQAPPGGGK